ncbi:hypothetical protein [Sinomonas soli]
MVDGSAKTGIYLEFRYQYRTLDRIEIRKTGIVLEGRPERAEELLRGLAEAWEARIGEFEAGLRARVGILGAEIARAQAVVDGYRFSREGELCAAEARLAEIDAELAAEAETAEEEAVAA